MPSVSSLFPAAPLAHRPPLARRFRVYSVLAYLIPVLLQVVLPEEGTGDELAWLVTLAPAFLLSLHYGLRGALAGLVGGTALFAIVQAIVALRFTPDDWRITLPIYIAYGTVAISVGWLSEELHVYYQRIVRAERLAAIGRVALGIRHELADSLAVIAAQSEIAAGGRGELSPNQTAALRVIRDSAYDTARLLERLARITTEPPAMTLSTGHQLLDLRGLSDADGRKERALTSPASSPPRSPVTPFGTPPTP
jgi:signal transduction histidine kinase